MKAKEIICKPIENKIAPELDDFFSGQERKLLKELKWKGFSAVLGDVTVGILLYSMQGKYILLERIFVKPGYRRNGIGKEMLRMLCKYAKAVKKPLLFSFDAAGNRDVFYRFVASTHDFVIERQEGFEAYLEDKDVLNISPKHTVNPGSGELFFAQKDSAKEEFITHLAGKHEQIAWELKHSNQAYRRDLCCCVTQNGVIQAVSLVKQQGRELELKLMYGRANKGKQAAESLLSSFCNMGKGNVLPVRISVVNDAEKKILDYIFPEYEIVKRFYVAYYIGS